MSGQSQILPFNHFMPAIENGTTSTEDSTGREAVTGSGIAKIVCGDMPVSLALPVPGRCPRESREESSDPSGDGGRGFRRSSHSARGP